MTMTSLKASGCVLAFLTCCTIVHALSHQQEISILKPSLARRCAADLDDQAERIFANPRHQVWKEYRSLDELPQLDGHFGAEVFAVKSNSTGVHFVRLIWSGEDISTQEEICFDKPGKPQFIHYQMRTAWGWGYEDNRTLTANGKLFKGSTRFFNNKSNKTIRRPEQADEALNFLKPKLYASFDSLPFVPVFKQRTHATP